MITLMSYSVKNGVPKIEHDPNYTFNLTKNINVVNTVINPWRVKAYRALDGTHTEIQDYLMRCKRTRALIDNLTFQLRMYGHNLTIGCHGGRHRSVAIVELLAKWAADQGIEVKVIHRDLNVKVNKHAN